MEVMIGIDIGTTNIKLAAVSKESELVFTSQRKNKVLGKNDHYNFSGQYIYQVVIEMLKEVLAADLKIISIGISSLAETVFPVFEPEQESENDYISMAWYDKRTESIKAEFFNKIDAADFFEITGLRPQFLYSIFKIKWYYDQQPELFQTGTKWLTANSFIAYQLTGEMKIDYSLASRTAALDVKKKEWSDKIFELLPFGSDLFPDLIECGTSLGGLQESVKAELGLTYDIPVSLSGHDHICGSYAVAGFRDNVLLDSMGTAENIMAIVDSSKVNLKELVAENLSLGVHVIPGKFYINDAFNYSGGLINSLISLFYNKNIEDISKEDFESFIKEAAECKNKKEIKTNILIGQNGDRLGNENIDNLNLLNIPLAADRGEVFMAAINYLCSKSSRIINDLERILNKKFELTAIGGSTKNDLLMQEKANKLKKDIYINRISEAVTLGAALLGGVGAGVFEDYSKAVESINRDRKKVSFK